MSFLFHHHDHASVLLEGDLEWHFVHDLVRAIETAVEYYHYDLVEIRVRSPGGGTEPLNCLLERLRGWRARGVRFRTRAVGRSSSAAALLVALGDERTVDAGVKLRFHGASMCRQGDISAEACAALGTRLSRANRRMIDRLVDRTFSGSHVPGEHAATNADREVLDALCMGAGEDRAGTALARAQTLAMALGQTIDEAIAGGDRSSLEKLYERLFQADRPISGRLARTLGLVDRVSEARSDAPGRLRFPTSTPFVSPGGELASETLRRHVLVLGDDADSAIRHCLAPLLFALARAPDGQVGPVLVLDHGTELRSVLERIAPDRLHVLDPDRMELNLMPGDRSLVSALEAGRWTTAAASILRRALDLVPGNPARFLLDVSGRIVAPVVREGTLLAIASLALALMLISRQSAWLREWLPDDPDAVVLLEELMERSGRVDPAPNAFAVAFWILGSSGHAPWRLAEEARRTFGRCPEEDREIVRRLCDIAAPSSPAGAHARALVSMAISVVAPFAVPAIRSSIHFGCESGFRPDKAIDFPDLVSRADGAQFLLLAGEDDAGGGLVAAAMKQLYCEAVLATGPRHRHRMCGLVVSQFERHARPIDVAFLDRARSVGGFAVLASRSVSAIEGALRHVPGGDEIFTSVWSGTGTKVFHRSTDSRTQAFARGLAPRRPGLTDLVEVRPLPGLAPDECYVSGADGQFERRRLTPWAGDSATGALRLGLPLTESHGGEPA